MSNSDHVEYSLVAQEEKSSLEEKNTALTTDDEQKVRTSSMWQSLVNLLSDIEGTGLLALPYVIQQGGLVAIIALAIVPVICCYTGKILIECLYVKDDKGQKIRVRSNYKDMAESCWPRYGGPLVFTTQVIELVLLASLYLVLCGSLIEGLLPNLHVPKRVWMCIVALIGFPTLFLKQLSHVAWFSLVSIIALTIAIIITLGYGISTTRYWDFNSIALWDTTGVPIALAIIVFSYTSHPALPIVEANMKQSKRFNMMLSLTYMCVFVIKIVFALFGFLTFSPNISDVITNRIPICPLKITVNSFLLMNVFFSYPFIAITLINCIEDSIDMESIRLSQRVWFIFIRVIVNFFTLLPAIVIPHFALMMSFIASLTGMFTVFIFPCLFHLYLQCEHLQWHQRVVDWFVIIFGVVAGITGLVVSGMAIAKSFQ